MHTAYVCSSGAECVMSHRDVSGILGRMLWMWCCVGIGCLRSILQEHRVPAPAPAQVPCVVMSAPRHHHHLFFTGLVGTDGNDDLQTGSEDACCGCAAGAGAGAGASVAAKLLKSTGCQWTGMQGAVFRACEREMYHARDGRSVHYRDGSEVGEVWRSGVRE